MPWPLAAPWGAVPAPGMDGRGTPAGQAGRGGRDSRDPEAVMTSGLASGPSQSMSVACLGSATLPGSLAVALVAGAASAGLGAGERPRRGAAWGAEAAVEAGVGAVGARGGTSTGTVTTASSLASKWGLHAGQVHARQASDAGALQGRGRRGRDHVTVDTLQSAHQLPAQTVTSDHEHHHRPLNSNSHTRATHVSLPTQCATTSPLSN